jgi:predicted nucleic acid-binding protein
MRAILDSGPLIAIWNSDDEHNRWAQDLFSRYSGPFYVSEAILTEVAHLTGRDRLIVEGLREGRLLLSDGLRQLDEIDRCLRRFRHCDLADATVVALSERFRRLDVLSTDRRHFVTYRRSDGSRLPVVLPD